MPNTNSSFWVQGEGSRPDLLCGRSATYTVVNSHFLMLVCSTVVLGGKCLFLNVIFPLLSELFSGQKAITTSSKEVWWNCKM